MKIIDFKVGEQQVSKMYVWDDLRNNQPKGVIQLVHGMAEHMGRYHNFAKFLNQNGYFVYGLDNRGHGLNTDMQHIGWDEGDMWSNDIADQLLLTEYIKVLHPDLPVVLHGHSYGSFIAQAYLAKNKHAVAVVLSGSSFMKGMDIWLGRRVANVQYRRHGGFVRSKTMTKLTFDSYQAKNEWQRQLAHKLHCRGRKIQKRSTRRIRFVNKLLQMVFQGSQISLYKKLCSKH